MTIIGHIINRAKGRSGCLSGRGLAAMALLLALTAGCESNLQIREKGHRAARAGDYQAALAEYDRAAERQPTDFQAHYHVGLAELELGRPHDAQLALEKALALKPADPEWTIGILDALAEAIYRQDRPAALHAFLERTTQTYGTTRSYLRQATYLEKIGDVDGAKLAYQKAAYFAPMDDASPYLAMAKFYASINDVPNAKQALKYALYVDPGNAQAGEMLRQYGIAPGPTVAEAPPKPERVR